MPHHLTLLFLDYRLLGNGSDCLRVLKNLHITLIDFFSPHPSASALILSLTDKNTLCCCHRALPSLFTCRGGIKDSPPTFATSCAMHSYWPFVSIKRLAQDINNAHCCEHLKRSIMFFPLSNNPTAVLSLCCGCCFFPLSSLAVAGICKETVSHINLLTVPAVKVLKTEIYLTAAA